MNKKNKKFINNVISKEEYQKKKTVKNQAKKR